MGCIQASTCGFASAYRLGVWICGKCAHDASRHGARPHTRRHAQASTARNVPAGFARRVPNHTYEKGNSHDRTEHVPPHLRRRSRLQRRRGSCRLLRGPGRRGRRHLRRQRRLAGRRARGRRDRRDQGVRAAHRGRRQRRHGRSRHGGRPGCRLPRGRGLRHAQRHPPLDRRHQHQVHRGRRRPGGREARAIRACPLRLLQVQPAPPEDVDR